MMSGPNELRTRATRLFGLALTARGQEMEAYAEAIDKFANDALAEAEEIERHGDGGDQT